MFGLHEVVAVEVVAVEVAAVEAAEEVVVEAVVEVAVEAVAAEVREEEAAHEVAQVADRGLESASTRRSKLHQSALLLSSSNQSRLTRQVVHLSRGWLSGNQTCPKQSPSLPAWIS